MSDTNADFLVGALEATLGKELGWKKAQPLIDECERAAKEYQEELDAKKEKAVSDG